MELLLSSQHHTKRKNLTPPTKKGGKQHHSNEVKEKQRRRHGGGEGGAAFSCGLVLPSSPPPPCAWCCSRLLSPFRCQTCNDFMDVDMYTPLTKGEKEETSTLPPPCWRHCVSFSSLGRAAFSSSFFRLRRTVVFPPREVAILPPLPFFWMVRLLPPPFHFPKIQDAGDVAPVSTMTPRQCWNVRLQKEITKRSSALSSHKHTTKVSKKPTFRQWPSHHRKEVHFLLSTF